MVPIMRVLGVPICDSQYFEMTTPDITPWSYPNKRNPEEHTEVIAATKSWPFSASVPTLDAMLDIEN